MSKRLEELLAALDASVGDMPPKPQPKPKPVLAKATVEVARSDPNWTKENRGRVEVEVVRRVAEPAAPARRDVLEEMYWAAVDREMALSPVAEVVHVYDPFSPERMGS
jgi:hypothetical protein